MPDTGSEPVAVAAPEPAPAPQGQKRLKVLLASLLGAASLGLAFWPDKPAPSTTAAAGSAGTGHGSTPMLMGSATAATAMATPPATRADEATTWSARPEDLMAASQGPSSEADARLMRIYALISTAQAGQALEEARALSTEYPAFGLAQLVYADLLTAIAAPGAEFGGPAASSQQAAQTRLQELVAEARARVTAAGQRPPAGKVPAQFVRLDPSVRHAVAVDVSRSRVYVLENSANGMVVKRDYYASIGKLGMSKQVEGDLRTPLGVYFVTGRIDKSRLPEERYGVGALALNYPNQYDQMQGRTGSGIWLHGVSRSLFTRAPLATDGCVVLSNPDLLDIAQFIERQETPVLIADQLEWVDAPAAAERSADFLKTFEAWQSARKGDDAQTLKHFYSDQAGQPPARPTAGSISDVSMLAWKDNQQVMVVTFTENAGKRSQVKRQYWLQQQGSWQVIFEGRLG